MIEIRITTNNIKLSNDREKTNLELNILTFIQFIPFTD